MFSIALPPLPIHRTVYLCDRKFHTEFIEDLYETPNNIGVVCITGEEVLVYLKQNTLIKLIHKKGTQISNNHRRGGQSAQRFDRKHDNEVAAYLKYMKEEIIRLDRLHCFERIYLVGNSDKKNKLIEVFSDCNVNTNINTNTKTNTTTNIKNKIIGITTNDRVGIEKIASIIDEQYENQNFIDEEKEIEERIMKIESFEPDKMAIGKKEIAGELFMKNISWLIIDQQPWNRFSDEKKQEITDKLERSGGELTIMKRNDLINKRYDGLLGIKY